MPYEKELNEYMDNLWDKQIGKEARDYLKQRHIKPSTAKAWNIGWCPKILNQNVILIQIIHIT